MSFDEALEKAIASTRRAAVRNGVLLIGAGLVVGVGIALSSPLPFYGVVFGGVLIGLGVMNLLKQPQELTKLRGATPATWVPSPSHGVLVVAGNRLLAAGLAVDLDRHATYRVSSVSYDETAHALQVQTFRIVQTRDGEREVVAREFIKLERSLEATKAYALAKELLALSLR